MRTRFKYKLKIFQFVSVVQETVLFISQTFKSLLFPQTFYFPDQYEPTTWDLFSGGGFLFYIKIVLSSINSIDDGRKRDFCCWCLHGTNYSLPAGHYCIMH